MFRIDDVTAATSLPTPEAAGTEGYFTEGNPAAGTPATNVRGSWLNMVQEELRAVVVAGGLTPSKTTYNQVLTAIRSMFSPVVGTARNLSMAIATASSTATLTADEIIVESALGGQTYKLAGFNKTINLATTGPGGIDYAGTVPASGFVGIYAIYNPTTGASALVAQGANVLLPNIYNNGSAIPSLGYTASALVSVVPTNASSQFSPVFQNDRNVAFGGSNILTSSAVVNASPTIVNALVIPMNAKTVGGFIQAGSTAASAVGIAVYPTSVALGGKIMAANVGAGQSQAVPFERLGISTPQRLFYTSSNGAGTPAFTISLNNYDF